jgi:hypothetical protein
MMLCRCELLGMLIAKHGCFLLPTLRLNRAACPITFWKLAVTIWNRLLARLAAKMQVRIELKRWKAEERS